jgi:hypothetical protein
VLAVKANVAHGLPLTLADRKAAAARITLSHPQWSDRAIAEVTGLTHKTVGRIRRRSGGPIPQPHLRVGRDGNVHLLPRGRGREPGRHPITLPREVVRVPADVLTAVRVARPTEVRRAPRPRPALSPGDALTALRTDPSLRFTESGRVLLRMLGQHALLWERWQELADGVPPHCAPAMADVAREYALAWQKFAGALDGHPSAVG